MTNDFERLAEDIISVVKFGQRGYGQRIDIGLRTRIAEMLVRGPGVTTWPRDEAEFCQRARDAAQRRPVLPRVTPRLPELPRAAPRLPELPRVKP